jgi:AcrR family transcriptional regulator
MPSPAPDPKANKAKLVQERSRSTRRKIVKSALQLWTSRGFDEGFDSTTVNEIADNAGVSRATVYYYFPKKEDILRELAWVTAEEIHEVALRSMMSGQSVDEVLDEIMGQLGAKISRGSSAAVKRMLQLRNNDPEALSRDVASGGLTRAFSVVLTHAQEVGDLPKDVSAMEIAEVISSLAMGCISKWSILGDEVDLAATLRRRVVLVLAGARSIGDANRFASGESKTA